MRTQRTTWKILYFLNIKNYLRVLCGFWQVKKEVIQ